MTRILFLTRNYFPAVACGGPIFKMKALAEGLCQRGHDVAVWTTDHLRPGETIPGAPLEQCVEGVPVLYLRTGHGYRWDRLIPGLGRYCRDHLHGFDVMHVFGYRDLISPAACGWARWRGIPYVLEPCGTMLPQFRSLKRKWLYDRLLGRRIVKGARLLIATSEQERADLRGLGIPNSRLTLRLNGISLVEFNDLPSRGAFRAKIGVDTDAPLILFLGRINRIKALDRLLNAFRTLSRPAHLVVAGPTEDPPYLTSLEAMAASQAGSIHFPGSLYAQEKLQALADADVLVLPSDRESFGNSAAEAVACGVPVVVTDTCGIAPIVANRAGLVVPPTTEALASALNALVCDPALRRRLAAGCSEVRRELSWEGLLDIQEEIYRLTIQAPNQPPGHHVRS